MPSSLLRNCLIVLVGVLLISQPLFAQDALHFREIKDTVKFQSMWRVFDVEAADLENDGRIDLIYFDHRTRTNFLRNDGKFAFTNVTEGAVSDGTIASSSALLMDYDNDGRLDILNAQVYGMSCLCVGKPPEAGHTPFHFEKVASVPFPKEGCAATVADFDGDGSPDILWCGGSKPAMIYPRPRSVPGTPVPGKAPIKLAVPVTKAAAAFAADFTGNGHADILFHTSGKDTTATLLLANDGSGGGGFTDVTAASGLQPFAGPVNHTVIADFNGDGFLDILHVAPQEKDVALYLSDGHGHFTRQTGRTGIAAKDESDYVIAADMNNDGSIDVLTNEGLYLNNGKAEFTALAGFNPGPVMTVADLDNDGKLDIVCADRLWANEGPCGQWLTIRLQGAAGNTTAIGAKVSVWPVGGIGKGPPLAERQVICASYLNGPPEPFIGLGTRAEVDLRVIFAPGKAVELKNVKANQAVTVNAP